MALEITPMTFAEIELALDWAAAEGWNPGRHDALPFQLADPDGFLIGRVGSRPAAVISLVRYSDAFAFLGLFIVDPDLRGRGHGWEIWQAAMERIGLRSTGLDGVVAQQAAYRRFGFAYAYPNYRFTGKIRPEADPALVDARTLPVAALEALDRRMFPAPRRPFLLAWLAMPESRSLALVADGEATGLGTIRRCRAGWKIGPLYAASPHDAERLLRGLALTAGDEPLSIDVPGPNLAALDLVARHGLAMTFETARMYLGPAPDLPLARLFGVGTLELG